MIDTYKKYYPSKILLFGEYTIIDGSNALAIPFEKFVGQWNFNKHKKNNEFEPFVKYLKNIDWKENNTVFFEDKLRKDLEKGLFFDSNIPVGYGAGSSGSLSAAIFDKYFEKNNFNIKKIKTILSLIEGFFHGVSSGIDPMVSYFNKGIKLINKNKFELISNFNIEFKEYNFYLLDTKIKRETIKYVNIYNNMIKTKKFTDKILPKMILLNNKIITAFLLQDEKTTNLILNEISRLQYKYFGEMIIEPLVKLWEESLKTKDISMKLCGAGGGGFYLIMIKKGIKIKDFFEKIDLIKI